CAVAAFLFRPGDEMHWWQPEQKQDKGHSMPNNYFLSVQFWRRKCRVFPMVAINGKAGQRRLRKKLASRRHRTLNCELRFLSG
ncbi:MAG: hypothetical protein ACQESR_12230, partial [Planctomycetota bacterium]